MKKKSLRSTASYADTAWMGVLEGGLDLGYWVTPWLLVMGSIDLSNGPTIAASAEAASCGQGDASVADRTPKRALLAGSDRDAQTRRMVRAAILGLCLVAGCNAPPFYAACDATRGCPASWHCSTGHFCTRYCRGTEECRDELGASAYCTVTGECWLRCGGEEPDGGLSCPRGSVCMSEACSQPVTP